MLLTKKGRLRIFKRRIIRKILMITEIEEIMNGGNIVRIKKAND